MCLNAGKRRLKGGTMAGFVVLQKRERRCGGLYGRGLYGIYYGGPYRVGKTYVAPARSPGFHFFREKRLAELYMLQKRFGFGDMVLYRATFIDLRYRGTQGIARIPAYTARARVLTRKVGSFSSFSLKEGHNG